MQVPADRQYAKTHEWFRIDGDIVTMGITQYAADTLTDLTFVELRDVGTKIGPNESIGEVESVKATSEVFTVMAGEIIEVNEELVNHPELINDDAFEKGWLIKLKANSIDLKNLLSAEEYTKLEQ